MRRTLGVVMWLGCLMACADKAPVAPSPQIVTVTGAWAGPVTIDGIPAQMTWTIVQSDANVTGRALISVPSGTVLMNGFLTGAVTGPTLPYAISVGPGGVPSRPDCAGQLTGTMTVTLGAASTLTGPMSVATSNCTPPFSGTTLTLTKQ